MNEEDVSEFVERAGRAVEGASGMSDRTADLRVVLPLLRTLGWDVRGGDVVADYPVDVPDVDGGVVVDYACSLDEDPVVFVVTAAPDEDLSATEGRRLQAAMGAADVDRGIATNAQTFVLVARGEDGPEHARLDLDELTDAVDAVSAFGRSAATARRDRRRRVARRDAADRLDDPAETRERVGRALIEATDASEEVAAELATAADAFVDDVADALAAGREPGGGFSGSDVDPDRKRNSTPADHVDPTGTDDDPEEEANGNEESVDGGLGAVGADSVDGDPGGEDDEEYVARFFDDRMSVGAVGTPTPEGALAGSVEFLFGRHALGNRLDLPWSPGEDDRAVLNHDPVHPDGTEMADTKRLSNGYYLCTALTERGSRLATEALADVAGLRVMFQGEWED
jgi:hypothetical protein